MKGWECGPASSKKGPSWEGEWIANPTKLTLSLLLRIQIGWDNAVYFCDFPPPPLLLTLYVPRILLQRQELLVLFSRWPKQALRQGRAAAPAT